MKLTFINRTQLNSKIEKLRKDMGDNDWQDLIRRIAQQIEQPKNSVEKVMNFFSGEIEDLPLSFSEIIILEIISLLNIEYPYLHLLTKGAQVGFLFFKDKMRGILVEIN